MAKRRTSERWYVLGFDSRCLHHFFLSTLWGQSGIAVHWWLVLGIRVNSVIGSQQQLQTQTQLLLRLLLSQHKPHGSGGNLGTESHHFFKKNVAHGYDGYYVQ